MLAIVIPYFKIEYFDKTLNSLAKQTNKNFKVYIGDDASLDNPVSLINCYLDDLDIIYKKFDANLGGVSLVKQWERCIALTNEDWIMILGDDDELGHNVVESWYDNYGIFYGKSNVIRFASKLIFEKTDEISNIYEHPTWEIATDSFYKKFNKISRSSLSEYIFNRESYKKFGFHDYPLAWNSDDHAWLDFTENNPIYTINQSTVYVRMSVHNISGKRDNFLIKNKSEIEFYKFLISKKLNFYNSTQRLQIIKKYGKEIKRTRQLKLSEWIFIVYYCIRFFNLKFVIKGVSMPFNRFNTE